MFVTDTNTVIQLGLGGLVLFQQDADRVQLVRGEWEASPRCGYGQQQWEDTRTSCYSHHAEGKQNVLQEQRNAFPKQAEAL